MELVSKKERQLVHAKKWRDKNPTYYSQYYQENRDKKCATSNEWRKNHPENARCYQSRYRARKRSNGGTHSIRDVELQIVSQARLCYWCSCNIGDDYEVDHFVPISHGGTDGAENIVVTCRRCNRRKHSSLPEDFLCLLSNEYEEKKWS